MPRHTNKRLNFFNNIVQQKQSQENERVLNKITTPQELRPELPPQENVMIQRPTFKEINIVAPKEDIEKKDKNVINKDMSALVGGFFTAQNKDKYISQNADSIKSLPNKDLQRFIDIIHSHI